MANITLGYDILYADKLTKKTRKSLDVYYDPSLKKYRQKEKENAT